MPSRSIPELLEELADVEESGLKAIPEERPRRRFGKLHGAFSASSEEQLLTILEERGWKARELALFELRLEARGTVEALRTTASEGRSFRRRRENLLQGIVYPVLLSLFLSAALAALQFSLFSGALALPGEGPPLPAHLIPLHILSGVLLSAALPLGVFISTRKRELPGRMEFLLLLRESLLLSPSLAASLRTLRKSLASRGLHWAPLEAAEGRLEEGRSLSFALEYLLPPLTREDLRLIETHPERSAAAALLNALIRHGELCEKRREERAAQLLPTVALFLVGVLLLLAGLLVVIPLMEGFMLLG
ncbi:MAG: hypothetical protein ACLFNP_07820 [Spirochaetaceae bacterium]